ncbi:PREDICTED: putative receptor-like protein kinase At4g00960 isoform X2 [Theobroma cacao]|uniref:Receptor-like protein kinase At4g00960 isoform X2 n=1 Tax=Theobroma cacao TaxID=3641 RepID=A0AB32V1Q8_THECC|nr:PREDICTED: putative receptor-like protein kinase At4g00960 isoform X2 [Theobroma cacao]
MWVKAPVCLLSHLLIGMSLATALRCYDTGNFTTNSTYGINRDLILASLPANVSANGGFFTATIGKEPNKVYALGLCRGDSTSENCFSSLNSTTQDLIAKCPNQKEAISWGGDPPSMVRYANRSFFGILELDPSEAGTNVNDIKSNLTQFNTVWESLMDSVVRNASMGSFRLKYSTGEADNTVFQKIHALMQCTPDLSQSDCDSCLRESVSAYQRMFYGKQGGYVQRPNCWFRWDLYPFYVSNATTTAPSLSPPPPPTNTTITKEDGGISSQTVVIIVVPIMVLVAVVLIASAILLKRRKPKQENENEKSAADEKRCEESFQFDFNAIRVATDDFSPAKKIGKGGFGFVYKGKLPDGQVVAVKRLSGNSGQGEQEFKNEVLLMVKLQHKNLVRLLGFSLEKKERIIIYEFVPNSSLDNFIFDPIKRLLLNWEKRYKIIKGIARGILYLHQDSQYRIIHRDLKAANILLDAEMNPKISDFGMAKLFVVDQTQADTRRIVGTYGYMAPEYARKGHFSVKSDVYSFGVLVLEIVSGKSINGFRDEETGVSLIIHAWKNWNEGTPWKLIDDILLDDSRSEMLRCIHLGLLCVQENIAHRPTMDSVVLMLSSSSISLRAPSRPAFLLQSSKVPEGRPESSRSSQSKSAEVQVTVNEASFSELDPR